MDYQSLYSKRAASLKPSGIRRFFNLAAEMDNVISLGVGEPDFETPWIVRQAGIQSLEQGETYYTSNAGLKELREEISTYLERFDLSYEADEVLVTVGGSEAIDLTIRAFVNPGDEVLIPEPCFVAYAPMATLCGGIPVPIVTYQEDEFRLCPKELKKAITDKTKLLIFPFPNNPTGGVMRQEHLEEIAEVLRDTQVLVLSDEIYAELTYGSKHVSLASLEGMRERTVVVNGFSKAFAMTGWRMGYLAAPKEIIPILTIIHQYAIMCSPTTSQYAAVKALQCCLHETEKMVEEYDQRRRYIVHRLNEMGLPCFMPGGAFYVFPDIRPTGLSSMEFCERLLTQQRLAVVPGDAFGESGEGFVRISYSYSLDHIRIAMDRIERFIQDLI